MAIFSHTQYDYELQKNIIPVHYTIPLWFVVYCLGFNGNFKTGVIKGKVFPYSLPSVGPGADPGVQAVSPQVT